MVRHTDCGVVQPFEVGTSVSSVAAVASVLAVQSIRSHLDRGRQGRTHLQEVPPSHTVFRCLRCRDRELRELGSVELEGPG